jgi:hypothetical protein
MCVLCYCVLLQCDLLHCGTELGNEILYMLGSNVLRHLMCQYIVLCYVFIVNNCKNALNLNVCGAVSVCM